MENCGRPEGFLKQPGECFVFLKEELLQRGGTPDLCGGSPPSPQTLSFPIVLLLGSRPSRNQISTVGQLLLGEYLSWDLAKLAFQQLSLSGFGSTPWR